MSFPTDKELVEQVHTIIVNAYQNGTVAEHSKRKVREMLTAHFGVDLEARKKEINKMTEDQNNLVSATMEQEKRPWAKASVSRSPSPARAAKAKAPAKSAKGKQSNKKGSAGPARKRKHPVSDDEDEDDGEEEYNHVATVAGSTTLDASDASDTDKEEFSELEEDTSTSRSRGKKSKTSATTKKSSSSSTSKKSRAATSAGGSEAEQRLTRLKKLVSECGVHKQWKTLYTAAGISATDYARQCTLVQGVLKDLGMTGKGSLEQARKIRAEREFADELAGLQENTVLGRTRKTRGSAASVSKAIVVSDDEASDYEEKPKKKSRQAQDSEDDEDEGPPRRKSFKSSLASFAADLNSDSH